MTDSFFDFATDLPALGSGKSREYENELLEAPEEDEIDQLNEETFGDAIEEDWEEHHEKLAEEIKSCVGNGEAQDKTHDSLEQSLQRLVIDDDDEVDYNGHPIPQNKKPTNVDNLFGPSSPPGFLNTEDLVGGQNIWGSPVCDSYMLKRDEGLKSLLKVLQKPKVQAQDQSLQDPSIISAVQSMSTSLPNAVTLQEIEQKLVENKHLHGAHLTMSKHQPCVKTVSEIEQELTAFENQPKKIPSPPLHGFPFPIGTPPRNQGFVSSPLPVLKPGSVPPPSLGMPVMAHGTTMAVPPPMPTPGHLSTSPPQSHPIGSPGLNHVTLLRRDVQPHHRPVSQPQLMSTKRSSPIVVHQDKPQGTSNDMAGSPSAPVLNLTSNMSSEHAVPPADGSPLIPSGPPHQRMQHLPSQSDLRGPPTSHHIQRPGPMPIQALKQTLASVSRNDHHHNRGEFHNNRGEFQSNRVDYHSSRGEFHSRGDYHNRGDFHSNRGDFHSNRGDFHNNWGDFHNSRGDFHNNRGDFHNSRGDFHNSRGDFHGRGEFHNNRGGFRGGRGDYFGSHGEFHNIRGYHGGGGYGNRDGYGPGPDGNPRFRGRVYYGGDNYRARPRYNSYNEESSEDESNVDKDEYAGLMTKKEKDWVIKIQLMQLQTDNPYLDDYYYTSWNMKRMAKERQTAKEENSSTDGTKTEPKLVIPHLARLDTKSYKPAQFENSLGRVTASSVHNPRQIIDIKRTPSTEQEDAKAREVRHFKEILLDIEKGYDLLLDVDDLEKKALGLPEENRQPLFDRRSQNIQALFNLVEMRLHDNGNVVQLVTVKKGIKLVCRLMTLLPQEENCIIVKGLLRELSAISKKDWQNEVLPFVYQSIVPVISKASLEKLVDFTAHLTGRGNTPENNTNTILTALQNKFGSSVIWAMINRGEAIYSTQSPVDLDILHQNKWCEFVSLVAKAVGSLSKDNLAVPHEKFPKVIKHVQHFLDKRTFLTVEDKLQLLLVPAVS